LRANESGKQQENNEEAKNRGAVVGTKTMESELPDL
jgi:hypothetical protein